MRIYGSITYEWWGAIRHALAVPSSHDVIIDLRARWVMVSRIESGTELVGWESVRSFSGWTLPKPEQRLLEPTLSTKKLCDSACIDRDAPSLSHRPFSHQPYFAQLQATGESHADKNGES